MKNTVLLNNFIFFLSAFLSVSLAQANFTYEGTLVDPVGQAVSGSVTFKVEILSPGSEACVLRTETHTVSIPTTATGYFSLEIGTGTGTNTYDINQVFKNGYPFTGLVCSAGNSFTGTANSDRKMRVTLAVGANTPELLGVLTINSVPLAHSARSVGMFEAQNLLRAVDGIGNAAPAPALSPAELTEFSNLLSGSSTKYMAKSTNTSSVLPSFSGSPSSPVIGSIWYDNYSGHLKYYNGTAEISLSPMVDFVSQLIGLPPNSIRAGGTQFVLTGGNVGIGTASPTAPLEVHSTTSQVTSFRSSAPQATMYLRNTSYEAKTLLQNDTYVLLTGYEGSTVERMRIDGNGVVKFNGPVLLVEDSVTACDFSKNGLLRRNTGQLWFCDGVSWKALAIAGGESEISSGGNSAMFNPEVETIVLSPASAGTINVSGLEVGKRKTILMDNPPPGTYIISSSQCPAGVVYSPANSGLSVSSKVMYAVYASGAGKCFVEWKLFH